MSAFDEIPEVGEQSPIVELPDAEPEDPLSLFMKQFNATLEERRNKEIEMEKQFKSSASDDMANWNQQREIRLNAKKDKNRTEEQVLLESFESDADGGNTWERITKMIDMSADADNKKSDVGRMKKIFIQLKNEPLETSRTVATTA